MIRNDRKHFLCQSIEKIYEQIISSSKRQKKRSVVAQNEKLQNKFKIKLKTYKFYILNYS